MNELLPNLDSSNLLTFWSFADEDVVTLLPLPQAVNEISMVKIIINFIFLGYQFKQNNQRIFKELSPGVSPLSACKTYLTVFLIKNKELKILVSVVRFHLWAPLTFSKMEDKMDYLEHRLR